MTILYIFFLTFKIIYLNSSALEAKQSSNIEQQNCIIKNWLNITESTYTYNKLSEIDTQIYDLISEQFFEKYKDSGEITYLYFAIHEAGRLKRNSIISELSRDELDKVSYVLDKVNNGVISENYFDLVPYNAKHIYHFHLINIPEDHINKAIRLLDYWLQQLPTIKNDELLASFKVQTLVMGYIELGHYEKAHEIGQLLIDSNPFPHSLFSLYLFESLELASRTSGYYINALNMFPNILIPIAKSIDDKNEYLIVKLNYANILFNIGNINSALQEYENIYSEINYLRYQSDRSALFNNLAISYLNTGRFDQYVDFQLNAFTIAQEEGNFGQQIIILRNLYIYYRRQNETELAYNYLEQALDIARKENLTTDIATILLSLGVYKRNVEDDPEIALVIFYEALNHAVHYSNYQQIFNTYFEIARTHVLLENFETAENYIEKIIDYSQSRLDHRGYILANIFLANSFIKSGKREGAFNILSQFTVEDYQQVVFNFRVMAHNISMQIGIENGNYIEIAEKSSDMISEIIDWLKESSNQETGHMRMDDEFSEAFRLHLKILYRSNQLQEALFTLGKLRNISRTGFYNNQVLKSQLLSEDELIQDYSLGNRIRQLRSQYSDAPSEEKVVVSNELIAAIAERNNLLNRALPGYRENSYQNTLQSLQRQLGSDKMVFYVSVFEGQVFRFIITRNNLDMKIYPHDNRYLDMVKKATTSLGKGNTNLKDLYEVYTTFFEGEIPKSINHIYFIPDGQFYMLPLEILPVSAPESEYSYDSTTYFIEKFSVSYANSLSEIVNGRSNTNNDFSYDIAGFGISDFTAAGHPDLTNLPFGPYEITRSTENMNRFSKKRNFLDSESTKENFREIAGKSRILHIATHSKVNETNPLFSALYMHNGHSNNHNTELTSDENTGILYAYELFDMKLNADLIFLSSCESGTGSYLQGTGILGFSRAFSYAGAQSLAINLWPIRDQTAAKIAIHFYKELNSGKNKAEALRSAQISYLKNNHSDPYLWGAFVLYGNIDPVISENDAHKYTTIFLFVLLLAGVVLAGIYFKKSPFKTVN